jgi:thiol-disulfide isomerase/thioredoxin
MPPSVVMRDVHGREILLSDLLKKLGTHKFLLLNVWAPWCAPCLQELPALGAFRNRQTDIAVATLAEDVTPELGVDTYLQRMGLGDLPLYLDTDHSGLRLLGVEGLPASLVFDRTGREVARFYGAQDWKSPTVWQKLRAKLGL